MSLFTQIQLPSVPINNLITGWDNQCDNLSVVAGSNNTTRGPLNIISGYSNMSSGTGSVFINGSNNAVSGSSIISGRLNVVSGQTNFVNGESNRIQSSITTVNGSSIETTSISSQVSKWIVVNGSSMSVAGSKVEVSGTNNVIQWSQNVKIFGDNNMVYGGLIGNDSSGTMSTYTQSTTILTTETSNIVSFGDLNIIGTNSQSIFSAGDQNQFGTGSQNIRNIGTNNIVNPNITNVVCIGDDIIANTSDRVIIGPNREVDIQSKVLSCDLIQTYTPTGITDSVGVSGWVTKDDDHIYVKTENLGWRTIPFNHTYGKFFDLTIQYNNPASTARPVTIGTSSNDNQNVGLTDSKITVNYDGMYRVDYSIQAVKTDSGKDDMDIWLRYNGTDVDYSSRVYTLIGNNAKQDLVGSFYIGMTANSYVEVMWSSSDSNIQLYYTGTQSGPTRPESPSARIIIDKIS